MNKLMIGAAVMAALNLAVLGVVLSGDKSTARNVQMEPVASVGTGKICDTPNSAQAVGSISAAGVGGVAGGLAPQEPKQQAFFDARKQEKIIRVGIQKNDCGCCQALQEQLQANGYQANFSYTTPTNDLVITEHVDRCRMVTIDGVPFSGYNAFELGKIVSAKFRGDLPGALASTRNYAGVDPREARPYPGEKSLIVIENQSAVGSQ